MLDHRDNEAQARSTQVPATVFSFSVSALGSMVSIAAACYSMLQPLKNHSQTMPKPPWPAPHAMVGLMVMATAVSKRC